MSIQKIVAGSVMKLGEAIYKKGLAAAQAPYERNPNLSAKVNAKVVSVGNITWGGTGKTPLVILLGRLYSSRGKKVAVLTRGYGQDELYELKNSLTGVPVLVGKDRVKTANEAVEKHKAEVLLLDDGFQYLELKRDLDIVVINAANPFGNGCAIPKGILREPLENLKRAGMFVLTKCQLGKQNLNLIRQKIGQINPKAPIFESNHRPSRFIDHEKKRSLALETVKGKRVALLSGIEDYVSFERLVSGLGAEIVYAARFNDHHVFQKNELERVFREFREVGAGYLITTAKDYYRMGRFVEEVNARSIRLLVLQIEVRFEDYPSFVRECLDHTSGNP